MERRVVLLVATSVGILALFARACRNLEINASVPLGVDVPGCEETGSRPALVLDKGEVASDEAPPSWAACPLGRFFPGSAAVRVASLEEVPRRSEAPVGVLEVLFVLGKLLGVEFF